MAFMKKQKESKQDDNEIFRLSDFQGSWQPLVDIQLSS